MQKILIVGPDRASGLMISLLDSLRKASYSAGFISIDDKLTEQTFLQIFDGCPPDIIIFDISAAFDCLPLRYVRHTIKCIWGDDVLEPLVIALCDEKHLNLPELPAFIDDFLLPPFTELELLSRLRLLLFRRRQIRGGNRIVLPGVTLLLDNRQAQTMDGTILSLRPKEYALLHFLATHRGKLFTRERLLDFVWGLDYEGGERTVDIHIQRLRTKLPAATETLLETQRGIGYCLRAY